MNTTNVKILGVKVAIGGDNFIVPPLNLKSLRLMQDRLANFKGGFDPASTEIVVDAAYAALLRNYPEISKDWLEENIDVANMQEIMESVMDASGLKRKAQEASLGEAAISQ